MAMNLEKQRDQKLPDNLTLARMRFQRAVRMIIINTKISRKIERCEETSHMLSFEVFHEDQDNEESKILTFNKHYFTSEKEAKLPLQVKSILRRDQNDRTQAELKIALRGLQSLSSFAEYPLHMQEKLVRVAHLFTLAANRVIIRQGHRAEQFYFLIHGTAIETNTERQPGTENERTRIHRFLRKGDCFGEVELLHGVQRASTVTTNSLCELLSIKKEDFFEIFLMVDKVTDEPAHVEFVKSLQFMNGWPVEKLAANPKMCFPHFYRKGEVVVEDSNDKVEWMYIIKSGSCRVQILVDRGPPYIKKKKNLTDRNLCLASKGLTPHAKVDHRRKKKTDFEFITLQTEADSTEPSNGAVAMAHKKKRVLVQIDELFPKDIFVSKGAECVILNKQFFMENLPKEQQKELKSSIKPYPVLDVIQNSVRDHLNWKIFKEKTILDIMATKKH
ncbi:cyclic nucleotide-binding domain-containing protein 2-like [Anneissia japonica]|uniref:cyclic nucleotide-binding domain-containing protein 2-like n=1 Tax=Anneissia japonica TaxID=1529436 RepID=UPI00142564FD|nr:cyclic nucleotide-binding domain-containing protein 2-like [Anneissia japonica]